MAPRAGGGLPLKVNGPAGRRASGHGPRRHTPLLLSTLPLAVAGAQRHGHGAGVLSGGPGAHRTTSSRPTRSLSSLALRARGTAHSAAQSPSPSGCAPAPQCGVYTCGAGAGLRPCSLKTPGSRFRHCQPGWVAARHPGDDLARMRSMNRSRIQVSSHPPELTVCMYITGTLPASTLLCVA